MNETNGMALEVRAVERKGNPNRKWLCNWFAFCITTIRWWGWGNRTMMMKKGKGMERLRPTTRTALMLQGNTAAAVVGG